MMGFSYRDGVLWCEDVRVSDITGQLDTPFYLYSRGIIEKNFSQYDRALAGSNHLICYAVKANGNLEILKLVRSLGGGAEVVSGGELYLARKAGIPPEKIVFSGVGKRDDEIEYGLDEDILMFNVESDPELEVINQISGKKNKKARVALRINPDINPKTHSYISTGLKENKFGISYEEAITVFEKAIGLAWVEVVGVHIHIGSQITDITPFVESARVVRKLLDALQKIGVNIKIVDFGGGLGIDYHAPLAGEDGMTPPDSGTSGPSGMIKKVLSALGPGDFKVVFEPGRSVVGEAGILVTRVLFVKYNRGKKFIVVDAGMNDFIRPSLYHGYHRVIPLKKVDGPLRRADVVGPVCESADFFAKDRGMPPVKRGELLAVLSTGAYGYSLSSNYNARPRVAEVMVVGDRFKIVRERESYENLV